ncbi:hypothetical protein COO60DRAFT_1515120 [Scenedesmus sp. NREL 46B-D3]|nr:hypothetical protein COO60DRAFT_1515120 [Scenedesmus sp. NREL 46B-D3]
MQTVAVVQHRCITPAASQCLAGVCVLLLFAPKAYVTAELLEASAFWRSAAMRIRPLSCSGLLGCQPPPPLQQQQRGEWHRSLLSGSAKQGHCSQSRVMVMCCELCVIAAVYAFTSCCVLV